MDKLLPEGSHLCHLSEKEKKKTLNLKTIYVCVLQYSLAYSLFEDHFAAVHLFYSLVLTISWALYLSRMWKFKTAGKCL